MGFKGVLTFIAVFFMIGLLVFYWVIPINELEFTSTPKNFSFGLDGEESLQFYPNMRFSDKHVSYLISEDCPKDKRSQMVEAFSIVENQTVLSFNSVLYDEEISINVG